ncbi:MAG: response regulator [Chloroflexota bacterium]|nr:response regulator [Chloroflexota bacterium]
MARPLAQSKRVLVVDDDPGIRTLLHVALEDEGYSVDSATNGREALDKIHHDQPSAILLDLMMPVMDGWSFLAACRRDGLCRDVPIIVMSAGAWAGTMMGLGTDAFIAKPFDLDVLLGTLATLC